MNKKKMIFRVLIAVGIIAVLVAVGFLGSAIQAAVINSKITVKNYVSGSHGDRIHFINVIASDAILIESNGKYGLIDCAEDSDNPRGLDDLNLLGQESIVIDYVKKIAGDANGKVVLDFVIGTHAHSDHIGGFDTLIKDPNITINKAYLKKYNPGVINDYEKENWDNQEVYDQMVAALQSRAVPLVQELADISFMLGNFSISILNGKAETTAVNLGENENSLGVLLEKGDQRAFLAGDINNLDGDETRLAEIIGKVDLLKVGHHGHKESTTEHFVNKLHPNIAIVTNRLRALNGASVGYFRDIQTAVFGVIDHNGLIAEFGEEIILYNNASK